MAALIVAGAAHVPLVGEHLHEAPYMSILFVLLIVACGVLAVVVATRDAVGAYAAAAAICTQAIVGYAATRTVAFPQLRDDVGNWLEPLGVVAVLSEASAVAFSWLSVARA